MLMFGLGRHSRKKYTTNQPEPTTEDNMKAIKVAVWIGVIVAFIIAINSFIGYFNQEKVSVKDFEVPEGNQSIIININVANGELTDWHYGIKKENEKEKEYVYVELHQRKKGTAIEEDNKLFVPIQEEDKFIGIKIDGEAYELVAVKDEETNEWRQPTRMEKIKYMFAHILMF